MTKEQAVTCLTDLFDRTEDKTELYAINEGIKSLKREIPESVIIRKHKGARYVDFIQFFECPKCKCNVEPSDIYCRYCGQALAFNNPE